MKTPEIILGNKQDKHSYDVETTVGMVYVTANTRTQAGSIARKAGYHVRSVNMTG